MNNQLGKLSDEMLVEKLVSLSKKETEVTADILLHLVELDHRRLYRDQGYPSLFAYCVGLLGYSPSAAKRRLIAARCMRDYPQVCEMFLRKEVTLTTIAIFAPALTKENYQLIFSQVSGKSPSEVECIVGRYNPSRPVCDRISPIVVQRILESVPELIESPTEKAKNLEFNLGPAGPKLACQECKHVEVEEGYRIEFQASREFKSKLDRIRALASGRVGPGSSLEQVLGLVMDDYINRHAPEKREERRKARERRTNKERELRFIRQHRKQESRRITSRTRDQVFLRDEFKCTFVSADGVPCRATQGLHLDHIIPKGLGGPNSLDNLRLLCGPHNRLVAEQEFGKPFMQQFY